MTGIKAKKTGVSDVLGPPIEDGPSGPSKLKIGAGDISRFGASTVIVVQPRLAPKRLILKLSSDKQLRL